MPRKYLRALPGDLGSALAAGYCGPLKWAVTCPFFGEVSSPAGRDVRCCGMVPNSRIHLMNINLEFRLPVPYNRGGQTFIPMELVPFFAAINGLSIF